MKKYEICKDCQARGPCGATDKDAIKKWNASPRKKDMKMEKCCQNCVHISKEVDGKVYCTKEVAADYSCKYWAQANPFEPYPRLCWSCKYNYVDDECAMYCGRAIGNPEGYVCDKWDGVDNAEAVKASVSTPLNPSEFEVTEVCPHCESEITMQWDVYTYGYKAYCPHCGGRLMLCTACHDDNGGSCDYDSGTDTCRYNRVEIDPDNPSNSSSLDVIGEIVTRTLFPSNVRQLIEEAAELIVACNKYIRATGNGQPTPVTEDQALTMIGEELADVHVVGEVMRYQSETIKREFDLNEIDKLKRWKERLKED